MYITQGNMVNGPIWRDGVILPLIPPPLDLNLVMKLKVYMQKQAKSDTTPK